MLEGKELLINAITKKYDYLKSLDCSKIKVNDINLIELLEKIEDNNDCFCDVTNEIVELVIKENDIKNVNSFRNDVNNLKTLLIGKRDYNLKVEVSGSYLNTVNNFITYLRNYITSVNPDICNVEEQIKECDILLNNITKNKLITNFDLIEDAMKYYDNVNFDKNMYVVMKYINQYNLELMKYPRRSKPLFKMHILVKPKIDSIIVEILNKFNVKASDLPNYLLKEFKVCDSEEVLETFTLIKKNKAEDGGILHLIPKENLVGRLVILLYATPLSIKNVVSSVSDSSGNIDINLLRVLINNVPNCFLVKQNDYFTVKNYDYIANIKLLKKYEINYRSLIKKTPLFMIIDNDELVFTLDYLSKYGASPKNIINRCYKTLASNPTLLMDNVKALEKYGIDLNEYFSSVNSNYNLIKMPNLDDKIKHVIVLNKLSLEDRKDYNLLNKLILTKIYNEVLNGSEIDWGNIDD